MAKQTYTRLREMPAELATAVRERIIVLRTQEAALNPVAIAVRIKAEFSQVNLPAETVRAVLRSKGVKPPKVKVEQTDVLDERQQMLLDIQERASQFLAEYRSLPPVPEFIRATKVEDMGFESSQVGVALFSDLHYYSRIDRRASNGLAEYNIDIARDRLARWRNGVLRFTQMNQVWVDLDELFILALGDDLEGHGQMFQCVDADTECLTIEGWRRYDEMAPGQIVMTYKDGSLGWGEAQTINIYPDAHTDMVEIKARAADMLLTPNHRCVVRSRNTGREELRPAAELSSHLEFPMSAPWGAHTESASPTDMTDEFAELLGWYLAEGTDKQRGYSVEISQSDKANPEKCDRIRALLGALDADWVESGLGDISGGRTFRIKGYVAGRIRDLCPNKAFPVRFLSWSTDHLIALYQGLMAGDGHSFGPRGRRRGGHTFVQKETANRLSDFQALCVRLGYTATQGQSCQNAKPVFIRENYRWHGLRGKTSRRSVPYRGVVWCPTTSTGTWVARRNGKVFITGNSQALQMSESIIFQMMGFAEDMTGIILSYLERYPHITIIKVPGNHGRTEARARGAYTPDNFELMAWEIIAERVRHETGGEWTTSANGVRSLTGGQIDFHIHYGAIALFDILGWLCSGRHGHGIRGLQATYTGALDNKFRLNAVVGEIINYYFKAHLHEAQSSESEIQGEVMQNGCFVGPSLLSVEMSRAAASLPSQEFMLFHPKRGKTHHYRIHLAEVEEVRQIEVIGRK